MQKDNRNKTITSMTVDTMDTVGALLERFNSCKTCNNRWKNDPYCPHSFDRDKVWGLKKLSKKIKFSMIDGKEKIEFFDEKDNLLGEYIAPIE